MGTVFNIQKFCINDGPGIRTTVFLKGCPLNCLWCHNPESKSVKGELLFTARKCIGCGRCVEACPQNCHKMIDSLHAFDRSGCVGCGRCAEACVTGALELAGTEQAVEAVLHEVMKEKIFYDNSGGGLTLSGGEPMLQFEFTKALLAAAKEQGVHTCMETCGYAPWEHYSEIAPLVDIFLMDYKLTDDALHKKYTGVSNYSIRENMRRLDDLGAAIILRCPIIPTINDINEHLKGIADMANSLKHILEINVEPYHPLGGEKSVLLGKEYPLAHLTFPENATVEAWMQEIRKYTNVPVKKA